MIRIDKCKLCGYIPKDNEMTMYIPPIDRGFEGKFICQRCYNWPIIEGQLLFEFMK